MKLVMFDIDGTLTQTYQADEACFVQALRKVFAFTGINTDWASYPHCSDSGILEALFQLRLGRSPLPTEIYTFQAHFVSLLTAATGTAPSTQPAPARNHAFTRRASVRSLPEVDRPMAARGWRAPWAAPAGAIALPVSCAWSGSSPGSAPNTGLGQLIVAMVGALILHSDRGAQFASAAYRQVLAQHGLLASMNRKGNCYDNPFIESFWSSLKYELVYHQRFATFRRGSERHLQLHRDLL